MTVDIAAFIRARVDEDEQAAKAAEAGPWRYNPLKQWLSPPEIALPPRFHQFMNGEEFVGAGPLNATSCVAITGERDNPEAMSNAVHIARHDPTRVLRGVEAKRRIVEIHRAGHEVHQWNKPNTRSCEGCGFGGPCDDPFTDDINECPMLRAVASEWSDHADYRQEWAP